MTENIVHLLDESRGTNIPKNFAEDFDLDRWNLSPEDVEDLLNPENPEYWNTWEEVLKKAECLINNKKFKLYQDGGLYAICYDDLTEEESREFFGE